MEQSEFKAGRVHYIKSGSERGGKCNVPDIDDPMTDIQETWLD
jgi:hypothetical protein